MSLRMHLTSIKITSVLALLLGLSLIVVGWLHLGTSVDSSSDLGSIVMGTFIVICSTLSVKWPAKTSAFNGANVVFGFWTAVSPWTYGYAHDLARLEPMVGIGMAVTVLGAWAVRSTFITQDALDTSTRRLRS